MKEKEPKKPTKADDPMRMKASDFDKLMRDALGVPPEPKEAKPKVKKKKSDG